jgi:hypothetical protein
MDEEAETKAIEKWLRMVDKPLVTNSDHIACVTTIDCVIIMADKHISATHYICRNSSL